MASIIFFGLFFIFDYLKSTDQHILNDEVFLIPDSSIQITQDKETLTVKFKTPLDKEKLDFPTEVLIKNLDINEVKISVSKRFIGKFSSGIGPQNYIKIPLSKEELSKKEIELRITSKKIILDDNTKHLELYLGRNNKLNSLYFHNERKDFTRPLLQIIVFASFISVFLLLQLLVKKESLHWNILLIAFSSLITTIATSNLSYLLFNDEYKLSFLLASRVIIAVMTISTFMKISNFKNLFIQKNIFLILFILTALVSALGTNNYIENSVILTFLCALLILGPLISLIVCLKKVFKYKKENKSGYYLSLISVALFFEIIFSFYIAQSKDFYLITIFDILLLAILTINSALEFRLNEKTIDKQNEKLISQARDAAIGDTAKSLAHDLRKPLTQMSSVLSNFDKYKNNPETFKMIKEELNYTIEHSEAMLQSLLDFSRESKLVRKSESLKECIKKALYLNRKEIEKYNVKIHFDINHTKRVDIHKNKIIRVISNLVANAIEAQYIMSQTTNKYILISTQEDQDITFQVTNNGPTIPKNEQDKLFNSFYSTGKPSGTGLGLSTCKKVINQHGKEIWVSSDEEESKMIFSFTLDKNSEVDSEPLIWKESQNIAQETEQVSTLGSGTSKVIIFSCNDDLLTNINIKETLTSTVESFFPNVELELHIFEKGEDLIEALDKYSPLLIICDYILNKSGGKLNGIETLQECEHINMQSQLYLLTNWEFDKEVNFNLLSSPLDQTEAKFIIEEYLSFLEKRIHS
jgi:signal transduction histidine kinase